MKVGVLTYHNNGNKGAILQAYGLCKVLEQQTQYSQVEIVNYRTLSKEIKRIRRLAINKMSSDIPANVKDYVKCEIFVNNYMPLSSKLILSNNHTKSIQKIEALDYDTLVVGSDEIWKIATKNTGFRRLLAPPRPFPSPYFLDPSLSAMKVSYAASANTTRFDKLTADQIETITQHLSSFDHISVRDSYTEHSLLKLGIGPIYRVPDPTIMTEIPSMTVGDILAKNGVNPNRPILGIHTARSPLFKKIADRYRKHGFQIVSPRHSPYADINLQSKVNPFEYYSLYDHFDMVVTSSLHSTIFSLKNTTPFVTVDVSKDYRTHESKTHSLLDDFSMLDRHYDAVNDTGEELLNRLEEYEKPLDERHISERIASLRSDGLDFFSKIDPLNNEN